MLKHTFIHVRGIGETSEQKLWARGVLDWDYLASLPLDSLPQRCRKALPSTIDESRAALARLDACWFAQRLPSRHHWRLYPTFRDKTAFLDIETTGMGPDSAVTTIALYDGQTIRTYVRDQNLHEFPLDIQSYRMVVTYNGRCFDIPFLEREFPNLRFTQPHCDLRYLLASLGYKGGLKGCEQKLGLPRPQALRDVDGFIAVLLWQQHVRGDSRALPALLRYNIEDAVNLQWLMETAYNLALARLPIHVDRVEVSQRPYINWPFEPAIIDEILGRTDAFQPHWSVKPRLWH